LRATAEACALAQGRRGAFVAFDGSRMFRQTVPREPVGAFFNGMPFVFKNPFGYVMLSETAKFEREGVTYSNAVGLVSAMCPNDAFREPTNNVFVYVALAATNDGTRGVWLSIKRVRDIYQSFRRASDRIERPSLPNPTPGAVRTAVQRRPFGGDAAGPLRDAPRTAVDRPLGGARFLALPRDAPRSSNRKAREMEMVKVSPGGTGDCSSCAEEGVSVLACDNPACDTRACSSCFSKMSKSSRVPKCFCLKVIDPACYGEFDGGEGVLERYVSASVESSGKEVAVRCATAACGRVLGTKVAGVYGILGVPCADCGGETCGDCGRPRKAQGACCREDLNPEAELSAEAIRRCTAECPACSATVQRADGCNHMTCPTCASHFCYVCGETLEAGVIYRHWGERCMQYGQDKPEFESIQPSG
jgi:hypothetical protein